MRWNRFWILGCSTLLGLFFIFAKDAPGGKKRNPPIRTIIIDPGHSAQTPGAHGKFSTEEGVVLDVALKLGKLIEANMKDVRVVYTRKTSNALASTLKADLNERAIIANREKGDLFISIHCNSAGPTRRVTGYKTVYVKKGKRKVATKRPIYSTSPSTAEGTETYVWATGKNTAKTESLRESPVIMLDANSEGANQVMDMSDPETFILLNTLRNTYFDQSLRLSTLIEDEFTHVGRISRGARQRDEKGIWVLQATAMPSVLVELGFISNPEEERYLNSEEGQQEAATCIYKAIQRYKDELGRYSTPDNEEAPSMQPTPISYKKGTGRQQVTVAKGKTTKATPAKTIASRTSIAKKTSTKEKNTKVLASKGSSKNTSKAIASRKVVLKPSFAYDIQLMITDKKYRSNSTIFNKLAGNIRQEQITINHKRLNKYIWGSFRSEPEANTALRKAKQLGFWNAFVLPLKNNNRLASR
ncbi:N-acetylmuramoyl-L-alanine amidase [Chitinophaga sp. CF118]|uniref:N-acetylmuramoyl-L-alanine amidase family protein n=1 Tax=Chitinophaga sp. CF118 TaxID=1884367 RepID=UPI0008ED35D6|nr:N-acetylmuramoyl-L-alanine amidase [Chitinophaga sp. CF118]SFE88307.1 N-acetylmuramoyl-L-alanine amidase [Chitinophaga sp. CF118]